MCASFFVSLFVCVLLCKRGFVWFSVRFCVFFVYAFVYVCVRMWWGVCGCDGGCVDVMVGVWM